MRFSVVNHSTCVTPAEASAITEALRIYCARHLCPAWGYEAPEVDMADSPASTLAGSIVLLLLDAPDPKIDPADALGYHDRDAAGRAYARIFCKGTLDNGGTVLRGANSISVTVSHEVAETIGDEWANYWVQMPSGGVVALELADPVEDGALDIVTSQGPVAMSNAVTPAWFNPNERLGPFDLLGALKHPFSRTSGGYWIAGRSPQSATATFGETMPAWKVAEKASSGRGRWRVQQADVVDAEAQS